jgi:hypothetical protein
MANPVGYAGRGTVIAFTVAPVSGGSIYTALPQLEKFDKTSAKVEFDDETCLDSPGIFDPGNVGITALLGYMQGMTQLGFKVTLIDGSTFTGLCYVETFSAPKVDRYKINTYEFGINVFGVEVLTPQGQGAINE